jgi:hypothetical protein
MKLQEIKKAILSGDLVCWKSTAYEVNHYPKHDQWLVKCNINNSYVGLTCNDEITLVGSEEDFFIKR